MGSEARRLTHNNAEEIAQWCGGRVVAELDALDITQSSPGINVPVGDGVDRASLGDLIIRDSEGAFQIFKN